MKEYVFEQMTLAQLLVVLCDHQLTFEQLRGMTMTETYEYLKRVNSGEVKSWDELESEKKSRRKK